MKIVNIFFQGCIFSHLFNLYLHPDDNIISTHDVKGSNKLTETSIKRS